MPLAVVSGGRADAGSAYVAVKGGRTVCATVESGGGAWSVASAQPGNSWESPNPGMRQLVSTATVPESGELVLGISFREVK